MYVASSRGIVTFNDLPTKTTLIVNFTGAVKLNSLKVSLRYLPFKDFIYLFILARQI